MHWSVFTVSICEGSDVAGQSSAVSVLKMVLVSDLGPETGVETGRAREIEKVQG